MAAAVVCGSHDDIDGNLDPTATVESRVEAGEQLRAYILRLVEERRRHPTDDVLSDLVTARDEEDRLSEDELAMLCLSLFLGGFETTASQLGATGLRADDAALE